MKPIDSLRKKTLRAVLWAGIGQYGSQGVHYVMLLILAGHLSPSDFGLLGFTMIFLSFAQGIGELGLAAAIVQKLDTREPMLSTAFWANLGVSLLLSVITLTLADPIAALIQTDEVALLLRSLSVTFPLTALSVIPQALLQKRLDFRSLALQRYLSEFSFGLVGVSLALTGFRVWSLIGAILAHRLASMITLWFSVTWRPRWQFSLAAWRELFQFGGLYMASGLANRGIANIDYLVIGYWFGTTALGYYTLAFQLAVLPQERFMGMLRQVAFPALSILQNNTQQLRFAFLRGLRHLYAGLLPVCIMIAVVGPWFVRAVYGDKWEPAIPTLQILAIAGLFYSFDIAHALYMALGKPSIWLYLMLIRLSFFSVFISIFGISNGIIGISYSLLFSLVLSFIVSCCWLYHLIGISPIDLISKFWPAIKAASFSLLPALTIPSLSRNGVSPWWICLWLIFSMLVLYGILIFPVYKKSFYRIINLE